MSEASAPEGDGGGVNYDRRVEELRIELEATEAALLDVCRSKLVDLYVHDQPTLEWEAWKLAQHAISLHRNGPARERSTER